MTTAMVLARGVGVLARAGVPDPATDARRLMAHALGLEPGRLTLYLPDPIGPDAEAEFDALIARRAAREPVSQITGRRRFYGRDFRVTADVLDPRPETEILIEAALAAPFDTVLDLGTGSGCILLTLLAEMEGTRGHGIDLSPAACAVARQNAGALGLGARAEIVEGSWFERVRGQYDLIVSNPPYISVEEMLELSPEVRDWEPRAALTDEADGLTAYRLITAGASRHLVPDGRLLMEIGPSQGAAVVEMAHEAGFGEVRLVRDLDGRDRVVACSEARDVPF